KPGLPLVLAFTVVNAKTCRPIKGADVEIWHCDASGSYSGFDSGAARGGPGGGGGPQTSSRYLRGHQRSNAGGVATFLTVFPGWYPGRTPHILQYWYYYYYNLGQGGFGFGDHEGDWE